MSFVFKACTAVAVSLIFSVILKKYRPEYSLLIQMSGALCVVLIILPGIRGTAQTLKDFTSMTGQEDEFLTLFVKASAVACVSSLISAQCRDSGNSALAEASELAGKTGIVLICMPMIKTVINAVASMLD